MYDNVNSTPNSGVVGDVSKNARTKSVNSGMYDHVNSTFNSGVVSDVSKTARTRTRANVNGAKSIDTNEDNAPPHRLCAPYAPRP